MKRSEMITALQNRFFGGDGMAVYDLADEILEFLESQGMQPPDYVKETVTSHFKFNEVFYGEWEPENDHD